MSREKAAGGGGGGGGGEKDEFTAGELRSSSPKGEWKALWAFLGGRSTRKNSLKQGNHFGKKVLEPIALRRNCGLAI